MQVTYEDLPEDAALDKQLEEYDFKLMSAVIECNFKPLTRKPLSKKKRITPANEVGLRDVACDEALPAFVARTIPPREARKRDDCENVVQDEYNKLRGKVWKDENVRTWEEVIREARKEGREVHVGSLHELVVEKGSELQLGDKTANSREELSF